MTDDRNERRLVALEQELATLRQARRRSARRAQEAERAADEALLRIEALSPAYGATEGSMETPALGRPLMARLDRQLGFDDAGSSNLYSANVLLDPLFETTLSSGSVTVGSSWTSVGDDWEARYRSVSGSSPTVTAQRTHRRILMDGHIYKSNVLVLDSLFSDVGNAWVELRPKVAVSAPVHIDWPWCVAAARVYVDRQVRAWTNLADNEPDDYDDASDPTPENYVRMSMVNGTGDFTDPDETGDEVDLEELSDDKMEEQVYVGTEDVDEDHWWFLQINLTSLGAGGIAVAVAEPQVNYTYQEAPMPYDPNLGNFDPHGSPKVLDVVDDGVDSSGSAISAAESSYVADTYEVDGSFDAVGYGHVLTVSDVGSVYGKTNWPHSAPPSGYPNCGVGVGSFGEACHEGLFNRYVVPADPTGSVAGMLFSFSLQSDHDFDVNKGVGVAVSPSKPTRIDDCSVVGVVKTPATVSSPETSTVLIPDVLIPAEGADVWIGLIPVERAPEGMYECNPASPYWPELNGDNDSWGVDATITSLYWGVWGENIDAGLYFDLLIGLGDGATKTFTGLPFEEGSCRWLINGVDTVPVGYDASAGTVWFAIEPGYLAPVRQVGYTA